MAIEKLPKNKDELRMYIKIKTAKFIREGGKIKEEKVTDEMYIRFMELENNPRLRKK